MNFALKDINTSICVTSDGAWGTQLQNLGLTPGSSPELWNREHPEKVAQVARAYVAAGSKIILTNTFGGNRFILGRHNLESESADLNFLGARISREAAGDAALVFGSIGPTGIMLMDGTVAESDLYDAFRIQAEALHRGGVDAILIETMSDTAEVEAAARAVRDAAPDTPLVISMTFDSGKDKSRTMMGVTPEQAVAAMEKAGAWMLGANCGLGPENYVRVCERMRAVTARPIWIKANAGMPVMKDGAVHYPQDPATFAGFAGALRSAGANVIGGCCGTTPEHIRLLSAALSAGTSAA
jgi:5-methyltetrahydrofolate--homocysteine methyltransferase